MLNSGPSSHPAESRAVFADAIRYWERRRIIYNFLLTAVVVIWIVSTWLHFPSRVYRG